MKLIRGTLSAYERGLICKYIRQAQWFPTFLADGPLKRVNAYL